MSTPLCCNCCEPMVFDGKHWFHARTRLLACSFRDREQQVNAQRKVSDVQAMERKVGEARLKPFLR